MSNSRAEGLGQRLLNFIERRGNQLPPPALLFFYCCLLMIGMSVIAASLGWQATLPSSGEELKARSLISGEGIRWMLTETINNFVSFAPIGTVLVVMLGLGIAEESGLLRVLLTRMVTLAPRHWLIAIVVFTGILSSLAADAGYVVLIPLAAMLFKTAGYPPLAGIAAAFAGVAAGFSANLLIGPLDVVLAGLSTEAVQLVDKSYEVNVTGNYYFMLASTVLLTVAGTMVTRRWVMPWLSSGTQAQTGDAETAHDTCDAEAEKRGLWAVFAWTVLFAVLLIAGLWPGINILRAPDQPVLESAFIQGIVVLITLYFGVAGSLYGKYSSAFQRRGDFINGMESAMRTMANYIVLMFFAAQFIEYFAWSQLGTIIAIQGANWLGTLDISTAGLLLSFIIVAGMINLFVGSSTAKWALIAPVFVPMLYLLGISPESTQMAYRIGDSVTNIITPLMPYFGVVIVFAQRYQRDLGIGTLIAMMLPYTVVFWLVWSVLFWGWLMLKLPLGPGATMLLSSG